MPYVAVFFGVVVLLVLAAAVAFRFWRRVSNRELLRSLEAGEWFPPADRTFLPWMGETQEIRKADLRVIFMRPAGSSRFKFELSGPCQMVVERWDMTLRGLFDPVGIPEAVSRRTIEFRGDGSDPAVIRRIFELVVERLTRLANEAPEPPEDDKGEA
jgi:hypothetical protein